AVDQLVDPLTATDRYPTGQAPPVVAELEALFTDAGSAAPALQAEELVYQADLAGVDVRNAGVARNLVDIANQTLTSTAATFADNRSGTFVRGLAVEQIGFGYGHPFLKKRVGIGGNVKYMMGTTFNKFLRYDDIDGVGDFTNALTDSDRREITHTASLDLGVMFKPWDWLRFGVTARDVTRPQFDLARDPSNPGGKSKLSLDPQVRAGAALWILPTWVVAFDADLIENESELIAGFESRIVSLGTEWKLRLAKFGLALRGGAYLNTASQELDEVTLTAGLGLRIADFNLDLAVGASPKTQKLASTGNERIPSQANGSISIAFRRNF
ncbi:conjugal transfer protein TraF, partial [Myxococcota bacterium]|nr:conjugal transfer protein TraF [Myxococcota bacterium]